MVDYFGAGHKEPSYLDLWGQVPSTGRDELGYIRPLFFFLRQPFWVLRMFSTETCDRSVSSQAALEIVLSGG